MKRILVILTILVWSLSACQNNYTVSFADLTNFSPIDTASTVKNAHNPLEISILYESISGNVLVTGGLSSSPKCNFDSAQVTYSSLSGSIETAELGMTNEVIRCKCKTP